MQKQVVKELMEDSSRPLSEIARKLGKSRAYIGKVKVKMERNDVIWGYSAAINHVALGGQYFQLTIRAEGITPNEMLEFIVDFQKRNDCLEFHSLNHVVHREHDYTATISTTDSECLCTFKKEIYALGAEWFKVIPISKPLIIYGKAVPN